MTHNAIKTAIISVTLSANQAFSGAWHSTPTSCTKDVYPLNPLCYKSMISSGYTSNSHAPNSEGISTLRTYIGAPLAHNHRLHFEGTREFILPSEEKMDNSSNNSSTQSREVRPIATSQLHLLAIDVTSHDKRTNFIFGVIRPAFGLNFTQRDEQKAFQQSLVHNGELINGATFSQRSDNFRSLSFSLGTSSGHNPGAKSQNKKIDVISTRYAISTSLLYKTNFYFSYLMTSESQRKFGFALLQSDYKESTTAIEFIRNNDFYSPDDQFFRISHRSPRVNDSRLSLQWDWGWDQFSELKITNSTFVSEDFVVDTSLGHFTQAEDSIYAYWRFALELKIIF